MRIASLPSFFIRFSKSGIFHIILLWISGLLFGLYTSQYMHLYSFSLMDSDLLSAVSIVRMLFVSCTPLFLCAALVILRLPVFLLCFIFFKSFCFSFSFFLLKQSFLPDQLFVYLISGSIESFAILFPSICLLRRGSFNPGQVYFSGIAFIIAFFLEFGWAYHLHYF